MHSAHTMCVQAVHACARLTACALRTQGRHFLCQLSLGGSSVQGRQHHTCAHGDALGTDRTRTCSGCSRSSSEADLVPGTLHQAGVSPGNLSHSLTHSPHPSWARGQELDSWESWSLGSRCHSLWSHQVWGHGDSYCHPQTSSGEDWSHINRKAGLGHRSPEHICPQSP